MNMISPMIEETGASTGGAVWGGRGAWGGGEFLGNDLARLVDVGSPFELHPDDGDPDTCGRAHATHAGCAVQSRLNGKRDLRFDFLRSHAVRLGNDGHRRS